MGENWFQNMLGAWSAVETAKINRDATKYQYSPYGIYREGQPGVLPNGGIVLSPVLLLVGAVALFVIMKD